jgi:pimeloyl-ACP methyl ester carboxylesterase
MALVEPTSHYFESQRLRLHYVDWGNPSAPPLLLIHGARDHCRSWDWVAAQLCGRWHVIAPDLRGHGDSAWSGDGDYAMHAFVYDAAQLIHHLGLTTVSIVGHSLGGNIATRFTGLYPDQVRRLVSIEGLGPSPAMLAEREALPIAQRLRKWIDKRRTGSLREPRRYATLADALMRMRAANPNLSDEQASHLTQHAVRRNDDGSWRWKYDDYLYGAAPVDLTTAQVHELWSAIRCPTLLCYGDKSWASNPERDGRVQHFANARVASFATSGHWIHHDQFEDFMTELNTFLPD